MEAAPLTFTAPTDLPVTEADSQAMEVQELDATEELPAKKGHSQVDFQEKLHEVIACGSLDFDAWTSLIAGIEKIHPDNIEALSLVYDSFLSMFPLCYGYWKKYANHKMHLCNVGKAVETFERAVQSATYSVGFWVEYCSFGIIAFEDPFHVRRYVMEKYVMSARLVLRLFKRGISFVGKDYLSHTLWDKYIAFEYSQQHWSSLPHIFLQALRFPTKKLHGYYQNLKKFVTLLREEMQGQNIFNSEVQAEALPDAAVPVSEDEISRVIKDLQDPSNGSLRSKALQRYMSIAEHVYHKACQLDEKIQCFEANVRRPFFHVKPLDENELANWHCYLDFIERQEDFDWAVKLYEKCLIACASYPEFWMRYVEFMETKGGRELANFALERATQTFLKNVPAIHLFNARFKEKIGDVRGARTAFLHCDAEFDSCFVDNVMKEANMERRLGNLAAASSIYEKALKLAADTQKLHNVSILYIHFSRLKYMVCNFITGCAEAARDIIVDGIKQVPSCRLLLEFVDLCGTNHDVRNAWNRHIKLFPHLIRTPSMHENPTSSNYLLNLLMEGKLEDSIDSPNKPSEGHCSKQLLQFSVQEEELSPPENQASQPDQVLAEQYQPNEIENSAKEVRQLKLQVEVHSSEDAAGLDKKFTPDLVHKSGNNDAFGTSELTRPLVNQPTEDTSRPMESAQDLVRQSQEDSTGESIHVELPSGQVKPVGASQDHFALVNTQQEQDAELQNCSEPVSLESLPLNLQEKASQHLVPMVCDERNIRQEIPTSSGNIQGCHPLASPNSSLAVQSAKVQNELGAAYAAPPAANC
ncbi:hypothetical protein RJ639_030166 [Escallonia herrerae]|uniref:Pre-mRNA-processing factor 39 n=1 Tax=Escallonia herrerae TaxID=1293975 RepID=A0AA88X1E4_9ASTE|nr:hypothetical protein RJ639_030166 [Escallonia herrerae]